MGHLRILMLTRLCSSKAFIHSPVCRIFVLLAMLHFEAPSESHQPRVSLFNSSFHYHPFLWAPSPMMCLHFGNECIKKNTKKCSLREAMSTVGPIAAEQELFWVVQSSLCVLLHTHTHASHTRVQMPMGTISSRMGLSVYYTCFGSSYFQNLVDRRSEFQTPSVSSPRSQTREVVSPLSLGARANWYVHLSWRIQWNDRFSLKLTLLMLLVANL